MSILFPILALLLVGGIAAYHRFSLAVFTAVAACALVAAGLLGGNFVATLACAVSIKVPFSDPNVKFCASTGTIERRK